MRVTLGDRKLLDQYEADPKVRRLAPRTIQTYRRSVEEFLRFHHDRTHQWIHPNEMGAPDVEAFLTHLAVDRRLAEALASGSGCLRQTFDCRGSQQSQNAHDWQPPIIPRIRLRCRGAKTVPSKGWVPGRRQQCRNRVVCLMRLLGGQFH